jgi:hypothetical protein
VARARKPSTCSSANNLPSQLDPLPLRPQVAASRSLGRRRPIFFGRTQSQGVAGAQRDQP